MGFIREYMAPHTSNPAYVRAHYPDAESICVRPKPIGDRNGKATWVIVATDPETGKKGPLPRGRAVFCADNSPAQAWSSVAHHMFNAPRKWESSLADHRDSVEYLTAQLRAHATVLRSRSGSFPDIERDLSEFEPTDPKLGFRSRPLTDEKIASEVRWIAEGLAASYGALGDDLRQAAALRIVFAFRGR